MIISFPTVDSVDRKQATAHFNPAVTWQPMLLFGWEATLQPFPTPSTCLLLTASYYSFLGTPKWVNIHVKISLKEYHLTRHYTTTLFISTFGFKNPSAYKILKYHLESKLYFSQFINFTPEKTSTNTGWHHYNHSGLKVKIFPSSSHLHKLLSCRQLDLIHQGNFQLLKNIPTHFVSRRNGTILQLSGENTLSISLI